MIGLGGLHQSSIRCLDGQLEERREQGEARRGEGEHAEGHFGGVHLSEGRKTALGDRGDGSIGGLDDE